MTTSTKTTAAPFKSDPEFLQAAIQVVMATATRIGLEQDLRVVSLSSPIHASTTIGDQTKVADEEAHRRLDLVREEEQRLRDNLNARLAVHRRDKERFTLAFDIVAADHHLDDDARMVLLLATVAAVSPQITREILGGVGLGFGGRTTAEACILMLEPEGTADWLKARSLFHRDSPLVRGGLLTVDYCCRVYAPAYLFDAEVLITAAGLAAVVGDPTLSDHEGEEHDA